MAQVTIEQAMQVAIRHHQAGRRAEAEKIYRQVLGYQPNHCQALHLLGVIANETGQNDAAVDLISRSIQINPGAFEPYYNLGNALRRQGRNHDAAAAYRQAAAINPNFAEAWNNLGDMLRFEGQHDEAVAACSKAIELKPGFAEAWNNLGTALYCRGELKDAINACRRALQLRPGYAQASNNLGAALCESDQPDAAIVACREAIASNPRYTDAYNNLGVALRCLGRLDEAAAAYRQALDLKPADAEAHCNLAVVLLLQGDFPGGFAEQEWRWKTKEFASLARGFAQPQWNGEELNGRTLLLHAEQGLGDTLQWVRYLSNVSARGGRVVLECQPELFRLLEDFPNVSQIVSAGDPLPAFDLHCPLMSLPLVLSTTLQSIPNSVPYLQADAQLVEKWGALLTDTCGDKLKVGLAWAGNSRHRNDKDRSMSLPQFAPLAAVPGVRFVSLQKGPAAREVDAPDSKIELIDLSEKLTDFSETAALIANLDLMITVDTAVAHLAGAMGKPVWLLLPFAPDWRWMMDRDDSPWYPTMRLFRQRVRVEWDEVMARVAQCLEDLSKRM